MLILIISIVALGIVAALFSLWQGRGGRGGDDKVTVAPTCSTCDGTPTAKCEQDCMMEASTKPVEYFDDEELDAFRGRPSGAYTDEEAQLFADVLYTMRQDEVAAWCRSLNLRGVSLPDQIKDETFMLMEG